MKLVEKCYPDLPYLSYEDGQQAIQNSSLHADTKEQMLTLLDQMQRNRRLIKAVQYMEKKGYKTKSLLKTLSVAVESYFRCAKGMRLKECQACCIS